MEARVKNYMFDAVKELINENAENMGICDCAVCRADIAAIVLNKLGVSFYVAQDKYNKKELSDIKKDNEQKIMERIGQANAIVSQKPRHDSNNETPTLKNYMEDCAVKIISKMIIEKNVEGEKFDDIIADALNRLPVKYVVSRKGELYSKIGTIETQFNVDIISAGVAAIEEATK